MSPAELQALIFDKFNREGSWVAVVSPGTVRPFEAGLVDGWEVLRTAPHAGDSGGIDFWVVWRQAGFLGMPQYVHVTRFYGYVKGDDNLALRAADGETVYVDFLSDDTERLRWREWQAEKKARAEEYASYYEESRPEIIARANS